MARVLTRAPAALSGLVLATLIVSGMDARAATGPAGFDPRGEVGTEAAPAKPASRSEQPTAQLPDSARAPRAPSGNPLWAIPLTALKATRDRPLFSPSRRPPPAASSPVAAVERPVLLQPAPEPEKVPLALVGTIEAEQTEGIGLFTTLTDRTAVRLKLGEDFKGWVLRAVGRRRAVLAKDQQNTVLELPPPQVAGTPGPAPENLAVAPPRAQPVPVNATRPADEAVKRRRGFAPPPGGLAPPPVIPTGFTPPALTSPSEANPFARPGIP